MRPAALRAYDPSFSLPCDVFKWIDHHPSHNETTTMRENNPQSYPTSLARHHDPHDPTRQAVPRTGWLSLGPLEPAELIQLSSGGFKVGLAASNKDA